MNVQDYNEPAAMTSREAANALLLIQSSRIWASTLQVARHFRGNESDPLLARFRYLNWKGERFLYLVLPESIELAMYKPEAALVPQRRPRGARRGQASGDGDTTADVHPQKHHRPTVGQ
jgi:hypothetical protein